MEYSKSFDLSIIVRQPISILAARDMPTLICFGFYSSSVVFSKTKISDLISRYLA